jgi:hypothetical protein
MSQHSAGLYRTEATRLHRIRILQNSESPHTNPARAQLGT